MEPDNLSLVALTPAELPQAQAAIVEWCDQKLVALREVITDLSANLAIATRNRWGSRKSLQATIRREEQRVTFYEKIKAALAAGYLIIPNFPVDAFAVRVSRAKPIAIAHDYLRDDVTNTAPDLSPVGEGRYVDDTQFHRDLKTSEPSTSKPGEMIIHHRYTPTRYDETWDFPLATVKPTVLTALERAMALKVFDKVGTVKQRRADPIIVGQIVGQKYGYGYQKQVTFFIAWWLNTEDL